MSQMNADPDWRPSVQFTDRLRSFLLPGNSLAVRVLFEILVEVGGGALFVSLQVFIECGCDDYTVLRLVRAVGETRFSTGQIETNFGVQSVKLPAGHAVLYPSSSLHRVEPVTEGLRLAIVGWVTSRVRDPARREVLFDLDAAVTEAVASGAPTAQLLRLTRSRSNLLRMWAE